MQFGYHAFKENFLLKHEVTDNEIKKRIVDLPIGL